MRNWLQSRNMPEGFRECIWIIAAVAAGMSFEAYAYVLDRFNIIEVNNEMWGVVASSDGLYWALLVHYAGGAHYTLLKTFRIFERVRTLSDAVGLSFIQIIFFACGIIMSLFFPMRELLWGSIIPNVLGMALACSIDFVVRLYKNYESPPIY